DLSPANNDPVDGAIASPRVWLCSAISYMYRAQRIVRNPMSILVTGGAGYIGSHMVYELVDAGERVVVLDNLSTGFDWAVAKGVPLIVGDTGDQNLVAQIIREHKVESIIHFAGWLVVPDSVKDPLGYYKNNTANSRALIETATKVGVRQFIFSS